MKKGMKGFISILLTAGLLLQTGISGLAEEAWFPEETAAAWPEAGTDVFSWGEDISPDEEEAAAWPEEINTDDSPEPEALLQDGTLSWEEGTEFFQDDAAGESDLKGSDAEEIHSEGDNRPIQPAGTDAKDDGGSADQTSEEDSEEDFWEDLFEDEDLFEEDDFFEEDDPTDTDAAEEGFEEADEAVALDDATVVPDSAVSGSAASRGARTQRRAGISDSIPLDETFLAAPAYSGSFGNQLTGIAALFYQKRVDYYASGLGTGNLEISFTKSTSPISFPADVYVGDDSKTYLDRTTEGYRDFHSQIRQAMQEAGDAFLYDHSEVFWVRGGTYTLSPGKYKDSSGQWIGYLAKIVYTPVASFEGAASLIGAYQSAVADVAAQIRSGADYDGNGQTDSLELALGIHDYLCRRLYYDNAALDRYDAYVSANGSSKGYGDFRIFVSAGAFLDSVGNGAVCEGYARAYKVLCDYFGIPCVLIGGKVQQNGKTIGHMWNGIQIGDKWYLTDATWDDGSSGISRRYFMVGNTLPGRTSSGNFSGSAYTRTFTYPELETESLAYCENLMHDYELVSTTASCGESGYSEYVCTRCGLGYQAEEVLGHDYQAVIVLPTCGEEGYTEYTCDNCGDSYRDDYTDALGHDYEKKITQPTCLEGGYTDFTCRRCGDSYRGDRTKALGHSFENGICTRCGVTDSISNAAVSSVPAQTYTGRAIWPAVKVSFGKTVLKSGTDYTLAYENNVSAGTARITVTGKGSYAGTQTVAFRIGKKKLSELTFSSIPVQVYSGKAKKPAVTVKFGSTVLVKGRDYTITYSNNKAVGKAKATVTGTGNYTGTKKLAFTIKPKPTAIRQLKRTAGGKLKVTWKAAAGIGGYQIQYAANSGFKYAKKITVNRTAVTKTLAGLKKGKTYYVRIRTWKRAGTKTYYSTWSTAKKKKIING